METIKNLYNIHVAALFSSKPNKVVPTKSVTSIYANHINIYGEDIRVKTNGTGELPLINVHCMGPKAIQIDHTRIGEIYVSGKGCRITGDAGKYTLRTSMDECLFSFADSRYQTSSNGRILQLNYRGSDLVFESTRESPFKVVTPSGNEFVFKHWYDDDGDVK
jgi:hypothetical protein